jgi:hypothetical protein
LAEEDRTHILKWEVGSQTGEEEGGEREEVVKWSKGGHMRRSDGKNIRVKAIQTISSVGGGGKRKRCAVCGYEYLAKDFSKHLHACRPQEEMTIQERAMKRKTRVAQEKALRDTEQLVERLEIREEGGNLLKSVGHTRYLGTNIGRNANTMGDTLERIMKATKAFISLKQVFAGELRLRTKGNIFKAVVMGIMLHHVEVQRLVERQIRRMEIAYDEMIRGMWRRHNKSQRAPTTEKAREDLGMESFRAVIERRTVSFHTHYLRDIGEGERGYARKIAFYRRKVEKYLEKPQNEWGRKVASRVAEELRRRAAQQRVLAC